MQQPQIPLPAQIPHLQHPVQVLGKTIFGGNLGLLEWSSDGHIRLFALDPATGQSQGAIFDCLPSQIQKARTILSTLELRLEGKTYRLEFSASATSWLLLGGVAGLFMAHQKQQRSGIQDWADALRNQGVTVRQFNIAKLFLFVLLGIAGFVLVIALFGQQ